MRLGHAHLAQSVPVYPALRDPSSHDPSSRVLASHAPSSRFLSLHVPHDEPPRGDGAAFVHVLRGYGSIYYDSEDHA